MLLLRCRHWLLLLLLFLRLLWRWRFVLHTDWRLQCSMHERTAAQYDPARWQTGRLPRSVWAARTRCIDIHGLCCLLLGHVLLIGFQLSWSRHLTLLLWLLLPLLLRRLLLLAWLLLRPHACPSLLLQLLLLLLLLLAWLLLRPPACPSLLLLLCLLCLAPPLPLPLPGLKPRPLQLTRKRPLLSRHISASSPHPGPIHHSECLKGRHATQGTQRSLLLLLLQLLLQGVLGSCCVYDVVGAAGPVQLGGQAAPLQLTSGMCTYRGVQNVLQDKGAHANEAQKMSGHNIQPSLACKVLILYTDIMA